jgi:hypothetical protein
MGNIIPRVAFSILVIICLADKYLVGAEHVIVGHPEWHVFLDWAFWVVAGLTISLWLVNYAMHWLKIAQGVRIHCPLGGGEVAFRNAVRGSVRPPGSQVQVFVFSGDRRWYLQRPPSFTGEAWEIECQFGVDDKPLAFPRNYKIAALSPAKPVTTASVRRLPFWARRSQTVRVHSSSLRC